MCQVQENITFSHVMTVKPAGSVLAHFDKIFEFVCPPCNGVNLNQ